MNLLNVILVLCMMISVGCLPNSGIIDFQLNKMSNMRIVLRTLIKKSQIFVLVSCMSNRNVTIDINWYILKSKCYVMDEAGFDNAIFSHTDASNFFDLKFNRAEVVRKSSQTNQCVNPILLENHSDDYRQLDKSDDKMKNFPSAISNHPIYVTDDNGAFYFLIQVQTAEEFNLSVRYKAVSSGQYLSAVDWPLLPFYKLMWIVYTVLAIVWLVISFIQFKDLLRIQFWIGAVILLGMLEKSVFYMEYSSVSSTGVSVKGMLFFAELVSCAKRSLSRMLVIIVSLGFGIVKPRLGITLVLVALIGALYFILASFESYLRIYKTYSQKLLISAIPLAFLDSIICWWIFSSLLQTIQVLKLRRNIVKLNLYRNFSFTLLFAVVLSIVFMLYSIREHKLVKCVTDWENMWLDEAFWHILFSMLLIVIMLLFRPTRNNQRYAFTQLLDNPEDEFYDGDEYGDDNDRDVDQFVNDAFDIKIRILNSSSSTSKAVTASQTTGQEAFLQDELKKINENKELTSIIDKAMPIFDSDDETNSKFEVSKMQ